MFFKHKNGSVIRVPQTGNGGPQGKLINNGGLDVYYMPRGKEKLTAFKKVSTSWYGVMSLRSTDFRDFEWSPEVQITKIRTRIRGTSATGAGHLQMKTSLLAARLAQAGEYLTRSSFL